MYLLLQTMQFLPLTLEITFKLLNLVPSYDLAPAYLSHLIFGTLPLTPTICSNYTNVSYFFFLNPFIGNLSPLGLSLKDHLRKALSNFPNYSSNYSTDSWSIQYRVFISLLEFSLSEIILPVHLSVYCLVLEYDLQKRKSHFVLVLHYSPRT